MDKNHQLKAPDNNELESIEQVPNRSELSALYFDAHNEWEGKELISDEERQRRRDKNAEAITTSVRSQFAVIGLLTPLPLILLALMLGAGASYVTIKTLNLLPAVIAIIGLWILISFLSLRRVYAVFYNHALRATPFILILLSLLGVVTQGLYILLRPWLPSSLLFAILIIGLCLEVASVLLSLVMLFVWVSPRLSIEAKMGCLGGLAGALLLGVLLVMFL